MRRLALWAVVFASGCGGGSGFDLSQLFPKTPVLFFKQLSDGS